MRGDLSGWGGSDDRVVHGRLGVRSPDRQSEYSMRQRGPLSRIVKRALPDFGHRHLLVDRPTECAHVVAGHMGGPRGLAAARRMLMSPRARVVLDLRAEIDVAPDVIPVGGDEHPRGLVHGLAQIFAACGTASFLQSCGGCSVPAVRSVFSGGGRMC